jgi:hypothetical protein
MNRKKSQKLKTYCTLSFIFCFSLNVFSDTLSGAPIVGEDPNYMWCWAAATKSLVTFYDHAFKKTITEVASVYTTQDIAPPTNKIPEIVDKNGVQVNLKSTFKNGKMTWAEMKKEADEKHPFIFVIRWGVNGQYYHCNVFLGYVKDSTKLYFMDPGGNGSKPYRSFTQCIGNNIDGSSGIWESSITTTQTTAITPFYQEQNNAGFRVVLDKNGALGKRLTLSFDTHGYGSSVLKLYNASGICVYKTEMDIGSRCASIAIPCSFASGMYYTLFALQDAQGNSVTGKKYFSIAK